jgi:hypothetical protein
VRSRRTRVNLVVTIPTYIQRLGVYVMQTQITVNGDGAKLAADWRREVGAGNPAGPLYVRGAFAEAEIVGTRTTTVGAKSGSLITGSRHACC